MLSMDTGERQGGRLVKRKKWVAGAALCLALLLAGCGKSAWVYRPITDVENLQGRRVGVNLAWEADYLLTGRQDMELYRYDETSAMVLALNADKVDAVAMDQLAWKMAEAVTDGLGLVKPAITTAGYVAYIARDREDLQQEFNEFLREFKTTEAYEELVRSREEFDGVNLIVPEVPLTGTGELLRVAYADAGYPRSCVGASDGEPLGFDVAFIKHFANARNYRVEFTSAVYENMVMGLQYGLYDLAVGYLAECYKEDVADAGLYSTDPFDVCDVYLVEKTEEKIRLYGGLD